MSWSVAFPRSCPVVGLWIAVICGGCTSSTGGTKGDPGRDSAPGPGDGDRPGDTGRQGETGADSGVEQCAPLTLDGPYTLGQTDLLGDADYTPGPGSLGPGVALGDLDGDGMLDAVVALRGGRSVGLRGVAGVLTNDGLLVRASGDPLPEADSVASADLDSDGDLDLVLAREAGLDDLVLWNDGGGVFTPEVLPGRSGQGLTPSVADMDGDGRIDLFIPGHLAVIDRLALESGAAGGDPSSLFVQTAEGQLVDRTEALPEEQHRALSFQGSWLDSDADGDMDLFISNDFGASVVPQTLLVNDGGKFLPHPACFCDDPMFAMGAAVGDPNGDGMPDLHVTNIGPNRLYFNAGDGTFLDVLAAVGARPVDPDAVVSWGSVFVDLDRDGSDDLLMVNGPIEVDDVGAIPNQPDALLMNDGTGHFVDRSAELGFDDRGIGRGIAVGDLDQDGRMDLVAVGRTWVKTWYGRGGCAPGVTVRLDAGPGNRFGIGAQVDVTVGDQRYTRWMLPSTTFSSSAPELVLGLGTAPVATSIDVRWPDGSHTVVEDVAGGERIVISRADP